MKKIIYPIIALAIAAPVYAQQAEIYASYALWPQKELSEPTMPVKLPVATTQENTPVSKTTGLQSRLLAITSFGNANNQYILKDSSRYTYSGGNGGDLNSEWIHADGYNSWKFDQQIQQYSNYNTYTYIYDAQGRLTESTYKTWDANAQTWKNYSHSLFTYNGQGTLASKISQKWDNVNNTWEGDFFITYTYDGQGQLTEEKQQTWENNAWKNYYLYGYTYNGNLMETRFAKAWNVNVWKNLYNYTYSYTNSNLTNETYQIWDNINNAWKNAIRYLNAYNASGTMSEKLTQQWNNNIWTNDSRTTMSYTTTDKLETALNKDWVNNTWVNDFKSELTYNAQDRKEENAIYTWSNGSWKNNVKYSYEYDANGNVTLETTSKPYLNTLWVYDYHKLMSYNSYDQLTAEAYETYNALQLAWILEGNDSKRLFYYEDYSPTSVGNTRHLAAELQVYPNPATTQIHISLRMDKPEATQLALYDMSGRIVMVVNYPALASINDVLDISGLAAGTYQCTVQTAQGQKTEKIAIVK